jgi:ATP-dependent Zn protease
MTQDDLTRFHEAGHAIVMIACGVTFTEVTVKPSTTYLAAVKGVQEQPIKTEDEVENMIVCALAGEVAEGYALSQSSNIVERDFGLEDVLPGIKRWATFPPLTEWDEVDDEPETEFGEWETTYPERDLPRAQRSLQALEPTPERKLELVKEHWQAIEATANALLGKHTLTYEEVLVIYNTQTGATWQTQPH